ncbi:unknown [Eggerthella sp. CAG:368]|nr:unknown [Eggerthella sp. CAG:368]
MTYRVIDKCEFSLLCGFVNDYELIAPVQKGRSYVFGMATCSLRPWRERR